MGIRDNDIERARQRMYIPVWQFQGWVEAADTLGSSGDGARVPAEIANGVVALDMDGDNEIGHTMEFPTFWDITEEIGVRVWWVAVGHNATTDAAEWLFNYRTTVDGAAIAAAASFLDTAIASQAIGTTTTLTCKRSPRGVINRNTFNQTHLDGLFSFLVTLGDSGTFTDGECHLLGISFDYMPVYSVGGQNALSTSRQ